MALAGEQHDIAGGGFANGQGDRGAAVWFHGVLGSGTLQGRLWRRS